MSQMFPDELCPKCGKHTLMVEYYIDGYSEFCHKCKYLYEDFENPDDDMDICVPDSKTEVKRDSITVLGSIENKEELSQHIFADNIKTFIDNNPIEAFIVAWMLESKENIVLTPVSPRTPRLDDLEFELSYNSFETILEPVLYKDMIKDTDMHIDDLYNDISEYSQRNNLTDMFIGKYNLFSWTNYQIFSEINESVNDLDNTSNDVYCCLNLDKLDVVELVSKMITTNMSNSVSRLIDKLGNKNKY